MKTIDRTAFPDVLSTRDPLDVDHYRGAREDPRDAAAVFPPPDVPDPVVRSPSRSENVARPPEPTAEASIYKEHSFRWRARDINLVPADSRVFEIARWRCPSGHLGIISAIATHLAVSIPIEDSENPGAFLEIGLNLPWQPWLHNIFGLPLRWWLRLELTRDREELSPVVLRGPHELPGYAFPELPTWTDQRFAWHWHGREPLRLLVPESHTARLFFGLDLVPVRPPVGDMKIEGTRRSALWIDPNSDAAKRAIAIASQGAIEPTQPSAAPAIAEEGAVKGLSEPDDSGLAIAGRLIGTLQTYRASKDAIEAARRGM